MYPFNKISVKSSIIFSRLLKLTNQISFIRVLISMVNRKWYGIQNIVSTLF